MVFDETDISKLRTFFDKLMKDEQEKQNVIMKEEALRKATQHPVFCAFFDEHFIITNNDKDRLTIDEVHKFFKNTISEELYKILLKVALSSSIDLDLLEYIANYKTNSKVKLYRGSLIISGVKYKSDDLINDYWFSKYFEITDNGKDKITTKELYDHYFKNYNISKHISNVALNKWFKSKNYYVQKGAQNKLYLYFVKYKKQE